MKTLAKCHVFNHCVIGEKTFQNKLIGPGKLPGLSKNGRQALVAKRAHITLMYGKNISQFVTGYETLLRLDLNYFEKY